MKNLMFVDTKEEAAMVEHLFNEIRKTLDEGKEHKSAAGFDWAAYKDGYGEYFTHCYKDEDRAVRIPYGSLVYVYRDIGNGWAVYDAYSFGYNGKFAVEKDIEGDLAGLCNSKEGNFPFFN